ncbi:MAG: EamA family transporter [Methanothrix sp.]|nr:EamA family transporter [Methanothrix sp.]
MDWLFFSLAGASSLAVTGVLDKFLLGKYVRNPKAYLVALIILQQIFALGIILFAGPGFTYPHSLYAMVTGGLQVALWTSYLRALQIEETSRVAALAYVFPVFVFLGSFLFLGEILTPKDYAGGFLLVLSSLLISYRPAPPGGRVIFSPALKYMVSFWIFTAAYAVASKYLLAFMDEWHLIMWSSLGSLLVVLPLLALEEIRREAFRYYRSGPFLFSALLADELFDFLGRASFVFGYALGSVALVSSVAALQPFITLIYVILLGIFMPGILKEELDSRTLALKISALFLIVVGVYMVS